MLFLISALISFIKRLGQRHHSEPENQSGRDAQSEVERMPADSQPTREHAGVHNRDVARRRICEAALWGGLGIALATVSIILRIWTFAALAAVLLLGAGGLLVRGERQSQSHSDDSGTPKRTPSASTTTPPTPWGYRTPNDPHEEGPVSAFLLGRYGPAALGLIGLMLVGISIALRTWSIIGLGVLVLGGATAMSVRRWRDARRD